MQVALSVSRVPPAFRVSTELSWGNMKRNGFRLVITGFAADGTELSDAPCPFKLQCCLSRNNVRSQSRE